MAERGPKALELWCRRMVEGYPGVRIDNMTTSWRDGLAFCAIIHHFRPELIDFSKLNKGDIYYNNDLAFNVAEKHLGIPALLEPCDMVEYEVPDRLSILTYVAQYYRAFYTPQGSTPSRIVPKRPAATSERGLVSPASTSPPTKMINRSGGTQRRDPCSKCNLPVFIAERLNVGKELYHRTCFRCARCNSQLSLANYYETDSGQFCCETCPDEEGAPPEPLRAKSLSDEEKSASLEKKQAPDSYSSMFESALENADDPLLRKDSTLTNQFASARSNFLTAQVESEADAELPQLPKTKPPDLKVREEPPRNSALSGGIINNSANQKEGVSNVRDGDSRRIVNRTRNSDDQHQAANCSDSHRVNSIVTKDNSNTSDRPASVRDRMKLFESTPGEDNKLKSSIPKERQQVVKEAKQFSDSIKTSSPVCDTGRVSPSIGKLCFSPIQKPKIKQRANSLNRTETETTFEVTNKSKDTAKDPAKPGLNALLEKQILKKSRTSPSLTELVAKPVGAESPRLIHQSFEDLSKAHQRKLIEDVSPLDVKLVDLGVIDSAPAVHNVEARSTTVDHPVSEQLVEKDDSQVLGDGDLNLEPTEEAVPQRSDDTIEVSTFDSVIEIDEETSTDNSTRHISQSGAIVDISSSVIDISDDQSKEAFTEKSNSVIEISDDRTEEDYPEDLNPFGDDSESSPVAGKSLNPFDEDPETSLPQRPTPTARKNLPPKDDKKERSLNPFEGDTDEEEPPKALLVKKKIPAPPLQTDNDTPEMLYVKRISVAPKDGLSPRQKKPAVKKVLAAPRISLNPVWSDVDDDDGEEEGGKGRLPVPTPRKMRHSTEQHAAEPKLKEEQVPSAFGSSSSLSSANSGGQSVRKKKPAPRPPILSPDRQQESAHSSLTSSPSTSAQHSPRLSASKNRKAKRAPPPPTLTPRNLWSTSDMENTSSDLSFIEQQNMVRKEWDKEKQIKDEENRNRQSLIFASLTEESDVTRPSGLPRPSQNLYVPNKSTYGKWKKKKGQAPSRPIPQKRSIKQLPIPEIKKELDLIELQQQGLERQGVRLEQIIRERCEGPNVDSNEVEPIDVDDLMLQLFEVVNEKNELCRRQAELMYLKRQQRLEEEHAEVEYEIRCLMMQPEATKTDTDKEKEEKLIARLVELVEKRNEIIECLEIDRLREHDEDASISNSMNTYAARRDETPAGAALPEEDGDKKDKKKKKKLKLKFSKKTDLDKDVDESESSSISSNKEKKRKKFALF